MITIGHLGVKPRRSSSIIIVIIVIITIICSVSMTTMISIINSRIACALSVMYIAAVLEQLLQHRRSRVGVVRLGCAQMGSTH